MTPVVVHVVRRARWCAAFGILTLASNASAASHDACTDPRFRGFDFMVGAWDIIDASSGTTVGHTTISPIEDGCALLEIFTGVTGRTGRSWNTFDPVANRWTQDFVGLGVTTHTAGAIADGVMHMNGSITYLNKEQTHAFKGIWKPLPSGDVDQVYYERDPKTQQWKVWFHSLYKKAV